ncbi:hypothetical protein JCGZ_11345 [Jatropha curcas]|uniref:Uncharacterized protein n=1 Tax=Jatropha curcas TaxID=180498 RepID=A0A067KGJ3_JATCU|nr:uncharacterized protein LOC119371040 [Jatropha curcas]KDP30969.1 hypothetical protein JCGZ_11345 [Jatropha curcas]
MFGRLRPSSSSLDTLERPPSKIFKDDTLSIYEATLMKLKLGSQRDLTSPSEEEAVDMESYCNTATGSESSVEPNLCTSTNVSESCQCLVTSLDEDAMTIDTNSSSSSILSSTSTCKSTGDSKQQGNRNMSLLYLFSKYQSHRHALSSSDQESMTVESNGCASISPSSSNCQSFGSTKEQFELKWP